MRFWGRDRVSSILPGDHAVRGLTHFSFNPRPDPVSADGAPWQVFRASMINNTITPGCVKAFRG